MRWFAQLRVVAPALALMALTWSACDTTAEGACEVPGTSQKCVCANGRGSRQVCSASLEWGACYCDPQACGDGDIDGTEQCDDGNNDDGDGCSSQCENETSTMSAGGNGPTTSSQVSSSTGIANGGAGGTGGAAGGAGGTAGMGGN
jgi:cysteine-rich repeat protein